MHILGKKVCRPARLDRKLAQEIINLKEPTDDFHIVPGKTLCANDFYEAQGRLDGAFCHYTENDKLEYLNYLRNNGIVNIEMECVVLAAMTYHVGIKCAIICVTMLDRLKGDQINQSKKTLDEFQNRPMVMAGRYIKKYLCEHPEEMLMEGNKLMLERSVPCSECKNVQNDRSRKMQNTSNNFCVSCDELLHSVSLSSSSKSSSISESSDYHCYPECSIIVSNSQHHNLVL